MLFNCFRTYHVILNLEDKLLKNDVINFKLHISMIAVIMYWKGNLNYDVESLSNIDLSKFNDEIIYNAIIKTNSSLKNSQA